MLSLDLAARMGYEHKEEKEEAIADGVTIRSSHASPGCHMRPSLDRRSVSSCRIVRSCADSQAVCTATVALLF